MKQIFACLLIIVLLATSVNARRRKEVLQEQKETKQEQDTIVEANHFSSTTESSTGYDIGEIEKDKSIVFYLKPHNANANDKTLSDNPINITLKDSGDSRTCTFNSYTQLCWLSKATGVKTELKIACSKTPCELSWMIHQPPSVQIDGDHGLDNLVSVNKDKNHAILKVFCNNQDLAKDLDGGLNLYTNSKYTKVVSKNVGMVFYLFNNEQEGTYFLTSGNDKIKDCANASLVHMTDQIVFNNNKENFQDYLSPGEDNSYQFKTLPDKDFRVDISAFDMEMEQLDNKTGLTIILNGYKSGKKEQLSLMVLGVDDEKTSIDFSLAYKKPTEKYDKMEMEFKGFTRTLLLRASFVTADVQDVELGEQSYFDLKKGQIMKYRLVPLAKEVEGIDTIHIFPSTDKFKASAESCPGTGCEFTIEAKEDGQGNIYLGATATKNTTEIIVQSFETSISMQVREGQQLYFSHALKAKEAYQLLVNSPSVVVYAASKEKCAVVHEQDCFQRSLNHHFPAIYESEKEGTLLFKVIGLDTCRFTLTVIDSKTEYITLNDTQPLTYLFDDKQDHLLFQFTIKEKVDVSINLIAPVNELNLYVINAAKASSDDWKTAELSADGFIKFEKEKISGMTFIVKVEKRQQFYSKYVHFTLIASTKQSNLQLESGVAHYQTIKPKDTRDYVFQFAPKKQILLNFYTHNIKSDVNINLLISNADEPKDKQNVAEFKIDREIDVLDIGLVSKRLCKEQQGENCELFLRLENMMDVEADITITLLVEDSIIELKDGIWQSYNVNAASATAHFYFLPKHQNHSATIFYKPTAVDLRIIYNVWKSDDLSINPAQWPFPNDITAVNRFGFKPLQYIHVQPSKLKDCWPNCVVLMSLITDNKAFQEAVDKNNSIIDASFRIMASNNYIQLPEKHKVDILLTKNETKELLVDLKYYLEKEQINFFTHYTIGNAVLKANVYSETNPRCPTPDEQSDFLFDDVETGIELADIKKKLQENSMQSDKNIYLCVLAHALDAAKFTIEFNSDADAYRKLSIDSTTTFKATGKTSYYYIENNQEMYLKLTRNEGFPYYKTKLCKPADDISKCFEDFKGDSQRGPQLANKVTTIAETPCAKCILLIKIETTEQSEVILHVQSKFTELELSQNTMVSDSLQINEQNRYTITGTNDKELIISIQIQTGDLKVGVHDFQKVDITKTNTKGSKNIHITVPPKDLGGGDQKLGATHMSSFGLSNFVHLHVTIQEQDPSKAATYTITYSSGNPVVYLQDGLIAEYNLVPKKTTTFIYNNPSNSAIYLFTSATDGASLKKLTMKYYAMGNPEDEDSDVQVVPEPVTFNKKTPNPTTFVRIPAKLHYLFSITSQNDHDTLFTIGINNREIIYLPFQHEYPIQLAPADFIYLVVNVAVKGYVKLAFSKCTITHPFISYTTNYEQFVAEEFTLEEQMDEDLIAELVLKVNASSAVYLKIKSSDLENTLMSIKATFSAEKIKAGRATAGDKGLIQYQLLDSTKAELTFTSLVCSEGKSCGKDFVYTALVADQISQIYAQLVCSAIMFDLPDVRKLKAANLTPISTSSASNNKITFTQAIGKDIEFVGVKAVNGKTGEVVYYQPVEIVTFWGELHRSSRVTLLLATFLVLLFGCGCLIIYRRYKKTSQYHPLGNMNDNLDHD